MYQGDDRFLLDDAFGLKRDSVDLVNYYVIIGKMLFDEISRLEVYRILSAVPNNPHSQPMCLLFGPVKPRSEYCNGVSIAGESSTYFLCEFFSPASSGMG